CTFCNIISTQDPEIILYEDEHCIAFKDIKPAAEFHLLVVPKIHKASVHTLNGNDADLIQHMQQVGQQLLDQKGISVENQ
ncbi:HIT-like domain-containing protein, partial [Globomyces pollinis-pini]